LSTRHTTLATRGLLFALILLAAACGSELPTSPRVTPPTVPPPPTVEIDWSALARLFDDPLFKEVPVLLENQDAAAPLNAAVAQLLSGIHARNLDLTQSALVDLNEARQIYFSNPTYHMRDRPLLLALSLFEIRGRRYISDSSVHRQEESAVNGDR
jgi:hypothetical protein